MRLTGGGGIDPQEKVCVTSPEKYCAGVSASQSVNFSPLR